MTLYRARPARGELAEGLRGVGPAYEVAFKPSCAAKPKYKKTFLFPPQISDL